MIYPTLTPENVSRDFIDVFGGYNHNARIGDNEFYDMENMSSSNYPLLSTRHKRGKPKAGTLQVARRVVGILYAGDLFSAYVNSLNTHFVNVAKNGNVLVNFESNSVSPSEPRKLILIGAYLIIIPDKYYINTVDVNAQGSSNDHGFIENTITTTTSDNVTLQACDADGNPIEIDSVGDTAPAAPNDGFVWLDTSVDPPILKTFYSSNEMWVANDNKYFKITVGSLTGSTIGLGFNEGDGVKITGVEEIPEDSYPVIHKINSDNKEVVFKGQNNTAANLQSLTANKSYTTTGTIEIVGDTEYASNDSRLINRDYVIGSQTARCTSNSASVPSISYVLDTEHPLTNKSTNVYTDRNTTHPISWIYVDLDEDETFTDTTNDLYVRVGNPDKGTVYKVKAYNKSGSIQAHLVIQSDSPSTVINYSQNTAVYPVKAEASGSYTTILSFNRTVNNVKESQRIYLAKAYEKEISEPITISRTMPDLDYVIESKNRLWGCRYGLQGGKFVNEIYCSKLGDFKNWNCFEDISTDSYVASCGSDGKWTGAVNYNGYPLFFKENHIHTVRGDYPPYNISDNIARGVKDGSDKSLAIINESLYYHSTDGICAYQGGLPTKISSVFGNITYKNVIATGYKNKYYCQMQDEATNELVIMVFDVAQGLWHKENGVEDATNIIALKDDLVCMREPAAEQLKKPISLLGAGEEDESDFEWYVDTGIFGLSMPDSKYISRLNIRLSVDVGAWVIVSIEYDSSGEWERLCTVQRMDTHAFTLPIKPRRCDHFRLRLEGNGQTKIYSISKTIEQGSDKVYG